VARIPLSWAVFYSAIFTGALDAKFSETGEALLRMLPAIPLLFVIELLRVQWRDEHFYQDSRVQELTLERDLLRTKLEHLDPDMREAHEADAE
jgi:hypothetical protein